MVAMLDDSLVDVMEPSKAGQTDSKTVAYLAVLMVVVMVEPLVASTAAWLVL